MNKNSSEAGKQHSSGVAVESLVSPERWVLPRLDFYIETNRERPVTLLIEEESGLIIAELSASELRLKDAQEIAHRCNVYDALVAALESMLRPPCILEGDSAIDVAGWFTNKARAALALATKPDTSDERGSVQDSGA